MILPVRRLTLAADDRPGDPSRRDRAIRVEVLESDSENLPDVGGGAEHHLDDLPELPIRPRSRQYPPGLPGLDRGTDILYFADREGLRDGLFPVQPGDVVHRVAGQDLVSDRECESEDDAGVLGAAVAALGELLQGVVAAGDPGRCQVFCVRDWSVSPSAGWSEREPVGELHRERVQRLVPPLGAGAELTATFGLHVPDPQIDQLQRGLVRGE